MKKILHFSISLWIISFVLNPAANAQVASDSTMYLIETTDGNEFIGYILLRNDSTITFSSEKFGTVNIPVSLLKKIEVIDPHKLTNEGYLFENPQATRYFFAPNGYGLLKGEAYYQNLWVFYNQISVGITNNFSLGVGTIPIFLFGVSALPIWVTPKFSIPVVKDKFNLGIGVLAGTIISSEDAMAPTGIFYGTATFGSRDKNLSIGLGYGFSGESTAETPLINISGMVRTGVKTYFLTENYIIGGNGVSGVISLGGRSIIKRISIDYGGLIPFSENMTLIIIPWLGVNVPIGKKKVDIPKQ